MVEYCDCRVPVLLRSRGENRKETKLPTMLEKGNNFRARRIGYMSHQNQKDFQIRVETGMVVATTTVALPIEEIVAVVVAVAVAVITIKTINMKVTKKEKATLDLMKS